MRRAALLALAVSLSGCATSPGGAGLPEGRVAARFVDVDGQGQTLAAHRGKVVLVTVLTTWNDFALLEIPLLKELVAEFGDDLQVLCVALDPEPEMLRIFVRTFELPYPVLRPHDPARFTSEAGPFGPIAVIPTSVLVDPQGRVAARNEGTWTPDVLRAAIRALVDGTGAR